MKSTSHKGSVDHCSLPHFTLAGKCKPLHWHGSLKSCPCLEVRPGLDSFPAMTDGIREDPHPALLTGQARTLVKKSLIRRLLLGHQGQPTPNHVE